MPPDRVEVWKEDHGWAHPYPWRFRVHHAGVIHEFAGLPNKCETKRQAAARGGWRLRWLKTGTFEDHYR